MTNINNVVDNNVVKTEFKDSEHQYLNSIMNYAEKGCNECHACVSGCQYCVPCGANPYIDN